MIYTITLNPAVDREMTVPDLAFDTVLRATAARVDCGGKGFNVSRMLAELGETSVALGFAGGKSGEFLNERLLGMGIETAFVWIEGETRTNVSIVAAAHDHYIKANEAGPHISAEAQQELLDLVSQRAVDGDWWVLAGSLPPNVPADFYADLTTIIQRQGGRVVLDTSGEALKCGCQARPYLIKPNDVEAQALTNLPVETMEERLTAARALQALGVSVVVMSLGKEGAVLVSPDGVWQATPPTIQERNPIGAGDSMVGGLVWSLNQKMKLAEALRYGIACGAGTASMDGTAVGSGKLVEQLSKQVIIQQIK